MTDKQLPNSSARDRIIQALYPAGLILVAIGAILHIWLPIAGGWILFAGGLGLLASHILTARETTKLGARDKRLMRMNFLGSAMYLISGGSAVEGRSFWLLFFIIGTVFVAYTVFALNRKRDSDQD